MARRERAMTEQRRRLILQLARRRRSFGLSQTQVAAYMGTSQSAVARLEAGEVDTRVSTLERYAAAIGARITLHMDSGEGGSADGPSPRKRPPLEA
jgi:transcriptional regulator with XRE-family HTH domain